MGPHTSENSYVGDQVQLLVHRLLSLGEECYRARCGFVLQLPSSGLTWASHALHSLLLKPGVQVSVHDFCSNGMPWRRRSAFIWFGLQLWGCFHACHGKRNCSYSGQAHVHPTVSTHGLFSQRQAFPYPHSFCKQVAKELRSALALKWSARLSKYFLAESEVNSEEPTSENLEWSQFQSAVTRREKQVGAPSACQLRHRANYRQPRKD
eukprot:1545680-Amphidinium_carterae.1